jgi:hypothetical protein
MASGRRLKSVNKSTSRTLETGMGRLGQSWLALSFIVASPAGMDAVEKVLDVKR